MLQLKCILYLIKSILECILRRSRQRLDEQKIRISKSCKVNKKYVYYIEMPFCLVTEMWLSASKRLLHLQNGRMPISKILLCVILFYRLRDNCIYHRLFKETKTRENKRNKM